MPVSINADIVAPGGAARKRRVAKYHFATLFCKKYLLLQLVVDEKTAVSMPPVPVAMPSVSNAKFFF
ncbi:MAG: hypothetical protein Q7S23_04235 [bacterium]|nr:hypothetical protein [bacterium]